MRTATRHSIQLAAILLLLSGLLACHHQETLFEKRSPSETGITFNNVVAENDSINPIDLEFLYNGGGVAAGDFNNDGLTDLYFTASTSPNKLYINQGNFKFRDITGKAGVSGDGHWCNGASVVDINNDGLADIYVCTTITRDPGRRKNLLYINQGAGSDGIPTFKEAAEEYHLADTSFSVHAAFFDYDNDGDLDMYLVTTRLTQRDATQFVSNNLDDTSSADFDRLFRNDFNDSLKHPVYTDVSADAGIAHHGYGLGVAIADLNQDGWKDIYVTNDFFGADLLYLNNRNGKFSEKLRSSLKHTSQNAMGNDVADINNDGLPDIIAVDMNPEDNLRKKKNMNGNNYYVYQNMMNGHYMLQYVRNSLQLNLGTVPAWADTIPTPVFGDIGFLAGVAQTDWSWNPSIADFDNDGNRDLVVTNGYPRDVTDHDFAAFREHKGADVSKKELIAEMPQIKVSNYAFRNKGGLGFEKLTEEWGMGEPSFSNGAIYADLDNDGDLDYVINNINDPAFVYENTINTPQKTSRNFLSVRLHGGPFNLNGIGATASVHYSGNKMQVWENAPYRGYLSTVENKLLFGLDTIQVIDSLVIDWPNGKSQVIQNLRVNQALEVDIRNATLETRRRKAATAIPLFSDVTAQLGVNYINRDPDFIDFNEQRLLPHKLSAYGPALACGDIDGNGRDDIIVSGTGDFPTTLLLQQQTGAFSTKQLPLLTGPDVRRPEALGTLLFDADADGDLDLYMASGSNQFAAGTKNYQDRLYANDGKGHFEFIASALPLNYTSKSCVKAADFDNDGDLDLFVGGRVLPGKYPLPVSSFIYRNDSRAGSVKFTDVTAAVAPGLKDIGLTCDAIWTDYDNDGWTDLVLAGEWMPLQFFRNKQGKLENQSSHSGVNDQTGWWNSITGGDFDNDGDIDYIVGNLGKNSFYQASSKHPVKIYAKDFDHNGSLDIIPTVFLPDEQWRLKEFPAQTRDDQVEQIPGLKKKFLTYKAFGEAAFPDIFSSEELKDAIQLRATNLQSSYLENLGGGRFQIHSLPLMAQMSPLYGCVVDDFNGDGNLDVAANGNDFGTEVGNGRYDAMNGLVMFGNGKGDFAPLSIAQSGVFIPGDGRGLAKLRGSGDRYLLAATQNNGPLRLFLSGSSERVVPILPGDSYATYRFKGGNTRREEFYTGTSFLSQSARFIRLNDLISQVEITDRQARTRIIR